MWSSIVIIFQVLVWLILFIELSNFLVFTVRNTRNQCLRIHIKILISMQRFSVSQFLMLKHMNISPFSVIFNIYLVIKISFVLFSIFTLLFFNSFWVINIVDMLLKLAGYERNCTSFLMWLEILFFCHNSICLFLIFSIIYSF